MSVSQVLKRDTVKNQRPKGDNNLLQRRCIHVTGEYAVMVTILTSFLQLVFGLNFSGHTVHTVH